MSCSKLFIVSIEAIILTAISLVLIGCQTSNIRQDYSLDSSQENNIAIVIGTVTQNLSISKHTVSSYRIDYHDAQPTKTMYSQITNHVIGSMLNKYEFQDAHNGGRLFVIELEAGRHQLDDWSINYNDGYLTLHPKVEPPALEFTVERGEIIYLGSFHIEIEEGKNLLGFPIPIGGVPSISDEYERDVGFFHEKYPQFKHQEVINNTLFEGEWIDEISKPEELVIPTSK